MSKGYGWTPSGIGSPDEVVSRQYDESCADQCVGKVCEALKHGCDDSEADFDGAADVRIAKLGV